jgi:hypothetical protein
LSNELRATAENADVAKNEHAKAIETRNIENIFPLLFFHNLFNGKVEQVQDDAACDNRRADDKIQLASD